MAEEKTKFTVGAVGIIFDDKDRVLLVHRTDYDLWNFPGGGVEAGEAPEETVIREIREETGLDAQVIKLLGVYTKTERNDISFAFICKVTGGQFTLNEEADQIEYFEVDKIPKNTSIMQVERLVDALKKPDEVILKIQKGKSSIQLIQEGKL